MEQAGQKGKFLQAPTDLARVKVDRHQLKGRGLVGAGTLQLAVQHPVAGVDR
jgi:hypothetical protein